jgi:hypothetical protein
MEWFKTSSGIINRWKCGRSSNNKNNERDSTLKTLTYHKSVIIKREEESSRLVT